MVNNGQPLLANATIWRIGALAAVILAALPNASFILAPFIDRFIRLCHVIPGIKIKTPIMPVPLVGTLFPPPPLYIEALYAARLFHGLTLYQQSSCHTLDAPDCIYGVMLPTVLRWPQQGIPTPDASMDAPA